MTNLIFWIIQMGARLPVSMKGGVSQNLFRRSLSLYRKMNGHDRMVTSNLGISNRLKVALPMLQVPSHFLFGNHQAYEGEYHTIELSALLGRDCSAFVDIGANWGFYSYFIANQNKPIYWFEPNQQLFDNLNENIRSNRLQKMNGSSLALADRSGSLTFYRDCSSDLVSSIVAPEDDRQVATESIEAIRFDDWVKKNNIPGRLLVKVDVENAEWQFIRGAEGALDKVDYLIIELLGPARKSGFVNHLINQFGFQAYYINRNNIEHVEAEDMRYTAGEYNWLFCRKHPHELSSKLSGSLFNVIV